MRSLKKKDFPGSVIYMKKCHFPPDILLHWIFKDIDLALSKPHSNISSVSACFSGEDLTRLEALGYEYLEHARNIDDFRYLAEVF